MVFGLGFRPDLIEASMSGMFWLKSIYAVGVAVVGLALGDRLVRPAGEAARRPVWLAFPFTMLVLASLHRLNQALRAERQPLIFDASASFCPPYVVLTSVVPLAGLIWAVRGLAPTYLAQGGAVIGVAAGGARATIYALHFTEPDVFFVGLWYPLGLAALTLAGAVLGPKVFQW